MYRSMTMHAEPQDLFEEQLKAVSNPVRRKILTQMKQPAENFPGQEHPYEFGVCAGKINIACELAQSTISAHLAVLQQAGLITAKRVGQWVFYKRNEPAIADFLKKLGRTL
jgi:DNA-binding transcriptional ArsR family regulator